MIFYNEKKEVLLYKSHRELYIPTITTETQTNFIAEIQKMTGILCSGDKVEELVRLVDYCFRYETMNNKLYKKYLERVREFYTCMIALEQNLSPIPVQDGELIPKMWYIDDAIAELSNGKMYKKHTIYGLEKFRQRVKEK